MKREKRERRKKREKRKLDFPMILLAEMLKTIDILAEMLEI